MLYLRANSGSVEPFPGNNTWVRSAISGATSRTIRIDRMECPPVDEPARRRHPWVDERDHFLSRETMYSTSALRWVGVRGNVAMNVPGLTADGFCNQRSRNAASWTLASAARSGNWGFPPFLWIEWQALHR